MSGKAITKNKIDYTRDELGSFTKEQLKIHFSRGEKINRTKLMKSFIWAEYNKCQIRKVEERTFRNLWYILKPILMRAEGVSLENMEKGHFKKWGRQAYQQLSARLSEMVLEGQMSYSDLSISDPKRLIVFARDWGYIGYCNNIVILEKDDIFGYVKNFNKLYNISLLSASGFCSTSLIEKLLDTLDTNEQYKLFIISDYDPYGYRIRDDFLNRAKTLGLDCEIIRVGITPEQVSKNYNLEEKVYPVSVPDAFARDWVEKYGLFDGAFGLEIQALEEPEEIREILAKALEKHLDTIDIFKYYQKESIEKIPNRSTDDALEELYKEDERVKTLELLNDLTYRIETSLETDQELQRKNMLEYSNERVWEESFDDRELPDEHKLTELAIGRKTSVEYLFNNTSVQEGKLVSELISKFIDNVDSTITDWDSFIEKLTEMLEGVE